MRRRMSLLVTTLYIYPILRQQQIPARHLTRSTSKNIPCLIEELNTRWEQDCRFISHELLWYAGAAVPRSGNFIDRYARLVE